MDEELRQLGNEISKKSAESCIKCNHKCFMYVVFTYISENSYDDFLYHYKHKSLPKEVSIAFDKFLKIFGSLIVPGTYQLVSIPWC